MHDFAASTAVALDIELLTPAVAGRLSPALPAGEQLLEANLYAVCEVAGRAARASSARQYRAIYTRFCDALCDELGRPPVVADVTPDAIAAYSRAQERHGGRGGRGGEGASPATRRVHLTMLRALLTQLGLEKDAAAVRVPSHRFEGWDADAEPLASLDRALTHVAYDGQRPVAAAPERAQRRAQRHRPRAR